jgi:hypothetical protein
VKKRPAAGTPMILDACVLIDFIKVDRTVLELVVKHVGPLYVPAPVVDEVRDIEGEGELIELGVVVLEPEMEDAYAAARVSTKGGLTASTVVPPQPSTRAVSGSRLKDWTQPIMPRPRPAPRRPNPAGPRRTSPSPRRGGTPPAYEQWPCRSPARYD